MVFGVGVFGMEPEIGTVQERHPVPPIVTAALRPVLFRVVFLPLKNALAGFRQETSPVAAVPLAGGGIPALPIRGTLAFSGEYFPVLVPPPGHGVRAGLACHPVFPGRAGAALAGHSCIVHRKGDFSNSMVSINVSKKVLGGNSVKAKGGLSP